MGRKLVKNILSDEMGSSAVEYVLIAAMIFLVSVGAITAMSDTFIVNFNKTSDTISDSLGK